MSLIQVENLTKEYEVNGDTLKALDNINLSIEEGEIFGVIGLSGAGKSTFVRCLNLLEKPTSGKVLIDGDELSTLKERELSRWPRSRARTAG